jgi:signal transduction histidine kinase
VTDNFRKYIFIRTIVLLAALIFICNLGMGVFIIRQNREQWKTQARHGAHMIAAQLQRPFLWDDRLEVREILFAHKPHNDYVEYIFLKNNGKPYAHTFASGVPADLLRLSGPPPSRESLTQIHDEKKRVIYDIAAPVANTDAILHLGVSRNKIDSKAVGLLLIVATVCGGAWLLCILPAWYIAGAITNEVDQSARALRKLNEELETRIEERTRDLVSANNKLNREVEERERLERQQADFFAMVTHDLKSPVAVIKGYAELILGNKSLDNDTVEMVNSIGRSSARLTGIINEFLTIMRLGQKDLVLNKAVFDLGGLIKEVVNDYSAICEKAGIRMDVEEEVRMPHFFGDSYYMQRALANLVNNAIKFTPSGGKICLKSRRAGDKGDLVMVSVSDTGTGIEAAELDKIFEKYYCSKSNNGVKGTGLGLAVVKAVAEAHGGRVEVESELGQGSTFKLILPVGPQVTGLHSH